MIRIQKFIVLSATLLLSGCGIYTKYAPRHLRL